MVFDAYVSLLFSKWDVLALAGGRFFLRGIGCIGAVGELEKDGETIYTTVQGAELYEVELYVGGERLRGRCDCPWAQQAEVAGGGGGGGDAGSKGGNFCKHCVAVALVYGYETERGQALPRRLDVRSYLELLDHDDLIDVLALAAEDDRKLRHLLRRRIAAGRAGHTEFRYPRR